LTGGVTTHLGSRRVEGPWLRSAAEAARFDRYQDSRSRYKQELIAELAACIADGPVLEVSGGFGSIGVELLRRKRFQLHSLCESQAARRLYERKLRRQGLDSRCRLHVCPDVDLSLPPGRFQVVYSVNVLHEWERPAAVLARLYELVRDDGVVVVNDLRRDADPFIAEYVLRELIGEGTAEGRYRARTFVRSLVAAYSTAELHRFLEQARFRRSEVIQDDAMTATIRIWKA
jgi:2-polyprenyl-3-methyl-5-hydroxy-6-metoxy-1,4-benzoquinol methylase